MKRFRKPKPEEPKKAYSYAVQTGDYAGEVLVYVESDVLYHNFLSLPIMENRKIPKNKFVFAWNSNIIDFVEVLPKKVYCVVEAQYKHNENTNNRREQFNPSHLLDCEESIEED